MLVLLVRSGGDVARLCGDGGVRLWQSTGLPFTPEPVQVPPLCKTKQA
ncbi:MAG: hypothetical protein II348_05170 [Clostridia bacterium]|nr:hypothetical protein [Clostridia bacterium]